MNFWKVAFFTLMGAIILGFVGIYYWATSPTDEGSVSTQNITAKPSDSVLLVETTADDFEQIAMKYLKKELQNSQLPIDFSVDESIGLSSELTVFGVTVPFSMQFDPQVTEEGNIILKQTSVNVGKLNLPPMTVLKLMDEAVQFPEWIIVRPNEEELFVDLSKFPIMSGAHVKAKEIDLQNNRILLEVIIPNE
ncbi:DUF2140 family protein [Lysinibacillus yapensis]|uniref:DUF2140 family protein n=1 Tax=Ureibacillus yapensis TaxID=2304605 RepID=A0A396S904_9BACL|nr:YpmS family protein [Lysinibacillus yapensis]RHW37579.1 DUF2140 family protein [Lysinibacillus yapensis]